MQQCRRCGRRGVLFVCAVEADGDNAWTWKETFPDLVRNSEGEVVEDREVRRRIHR